MRIVSILLLLAAILAAPGAHAAAPVVLEVPDVHVHNDGANVPVPTSTVVPVHVSGSIVVNPIDVSVDQTRCSIPTDAKIGGIAQASDDCHAGAVHTSDTTPSKLVDADLSLALPSAPAAAPAAPAPVKTQAAIVEAAPQSATVLAAAAAAGVSLLGIYAIWRVLKWTGLAAILPLYSHISDNEILDDANRANIYRLIQSEPGISTKDIADRLDLAWGTVTHHLGKLEKRRFVVSKKYGKYRRYFANGAGGVQEKDALAVLRLDRTGDVAALIQQQPGLTQKAVSQMLGVSSSTILWHVKRLEEVQLVRKVRDGKLVRYYPGEGMQGVAVIPAAPTISAA